MLCPVCNAAMVIVEYRNIELDYCTACKGVWFDSGELELLLESVNLENTNQFLGQIINQPEAASTEKKHKCPTCLKKMRKVFIDDTVLIDTCRHGHGIWLDNREILHIVTLLAEKSRGKPGPSQEVMSYLGEVFKY